jgi:thioredoxin-related protein
MSVSACRTACFVSSVLLLLSAVVSSAAEARWLRDVPQAWTAAQQAQRPLVIYISKKGCKYCERMTRETLAHPTIQQKLVSGYVLSAFDSQMHRDWAQHFKVQSFPTTLVFSPTGQVLASKIGYVAPQEFYQLLQNLDGGQVPAATRYARQATPAGR